MQALIKALQTERQKKGETWQILRREKDTRDNEIKKLRDLSLNELVTEPVPSLPHDLLKKVGLFECWALVDFARLNLHFPLLCTKNLLINLISQSLERIYAR